MSGEKTRCASGTDGALRVGAAGTEVLRLTDALDRARKETARLQSALSEAERGFDADKAGRCKAELVFSVAAIDPRVL